MSPTKQAKPPAGDKAGPNKKSSRPSITTTADGKRHDPPTKKKSSIDGGTSKADSKNTQKNKMDGAGLKLEGHNTSAPETSTSEGISEGKPKALKKRKRPLLPIEELFGESLISASGDSKSSREFLIDDCTIGLYFGANWCPPCKMLFPALVILYEEVRKAGRQFEMVYVSFDRSEESFREYLSKMPWWAVAFTDEDKREELAVKFNIGGIPIFALVDAKSLEVITSNGRAFVAFDPRGDNFPWRDMSEPQLPVPNGPPPPRSRARKEEAGSNSTIHNTEESGGSLDGEGRLPSSNTPSEDNGGETIIDNAEADADGENKSNNDRLSGRKSTIL